MLISTRRIRRFRLRGQTMAETKIEWTDATWNPLVGCSVISPGCKHCYAMKLAARLAAMGQARYDGLTKPSKAGAVWTGEMRFVDEALMVPLRRRKPTMWFVNSMSDLFHEDVPDEWIDRIFAVMALAPKHVFQVLTKRAERMRNYARAPKVARRVYEIACDMVLRDNGIDVVLLNDRQQEMFAPPGPRVLLGAWPLPNVWFGVSTEDQARADERVPHLLETPAAVRFVSAEPLLSHISFRGLNLVSDRPSDALKGVRAEPADNEQGYCNVPTAKLDWIIVGGESGAGARPFEADWARSIRDQCKSAGTWFFMKQMGGAMKSRLPPIPPDLMIREMPA